DAQPIFVGYGISDAKFDYDSYAGIGDLLEGKIAIAFRYEPQDARGQSRWALKDHQTMGAWTSSASLLQKARWAADHGAAALLVVNPPVQTGPGGTHDALRSTRATGGVDE